MTAHCRWLNAGQRSAAHSSEQPLDPLSTLPRRRRDMICTLHGSCCCAACASCSLLVQRCPICAPRDCMCVALSFPRRLPSRTRSSLVRPSRCPSSCDSGTRCVCKWQTAHVAYACKRALSQACTRAAGVHTRRAEPFRSPLGAHRVAPSADAPLSPRASCASYVPRVAPRRTRTGRSSGSSCGR